LKSVEDVVETCWAAKEESGITFVHLNGGYQGTHGLEFIKPYVEAIKRRVGLLVGVQLAPEREFSRYHELIALGVDHLSFCVELMDPRWFATICPGKAAVHGQQLYFDAMEHCARLLPHGAVSGEIIAGLEPVESTIAAIDRIAALSAFPTVCIFRPTIGSAMEDWIPAQHAEMRQVMAHVYDACRAHWIPIGAAPNIEVSLVVNPDDAALLATRDVRFYLYEAYRRIARVAAGPIYRRRLRPRA
jgi:biotin synthase-related radical SAM superfamily protein